MHFKKYGYFWPLQFPFEGMIFFWSISAPWRRFCWVKLLIRRSFFEKIASFISQERMIIKTSLSTYQKHIIFFSHVFNFQWKKIVIYHQNPQKQLNTTINYRNRLDKLTDLQILPTILLDKITKHFHLQLKIFGLIGKDTIERGQKPGRYTRWRHHH